MMRVKPDILTGEECVHKMFRDLRRRDSDPVFAVTGDMAEEGAASIVDKGALRSLTDFIHVEGEGPPAKVDGSGDRPDKADERGQPEEAA